MSDQLEIMRMAQAMARHAASRQAVIARNIAHADTPGYQARDIGSFADIYSAAEPRPMRATRSGHLPVDAAMDFSASQSADRRNGSPNGNTVSLETEMMNSVDAQRQHGKALTIYSKSLEILRMSLGRIR